MNQLKIDWSPADRTATWPANPAHPYGEPIDEQAGCAVFMLRQPALSRTGLRHLVDLLPRLPQDDCRDRRRPHR